MVPFLYEFQKYLKMMALNRGNQKLKSLFCLIFVQASNNNNNNNNNYNYRKTFVGFMELDNVICKISRLQSTCIAGDKKKELFCKRSKRVGSYMRVFASCLMSCPL